MSKVSQNDRFFNSFLSSNNSPKEIKFPKEISEQKFVAETFRILERAVEQSIDGIAVANLDGIIRFCNDAWAEMHGYCVTEIIGKHLGIFHTKEQLEGDVIPFNETVKKRGSYQGEVGHVKKDGTCFETWMTVTLLKDENGKQIGILGIARDITEKRRIAEALRKSEEQYRKTIDSMAEAIHVVDRDLKIQLFNPVFLKWNKELGLTIDVAGKGLFEVFPFLSDKVRDEYQEVFKTGNVLITEESNKIKDKNITTQTRKIPVYDKGEVVQVVTIIEDITERKLSEGWIRESENKYKTLLKNIPQKIFYKDLNSVYVLCNESYASDLGLTPDATKGKTDYDFFPKELADKYRRDDIEIIQTGKAKEIEEKYLVNGQELFVHTFKAPLKDIDGNTIGIFGVFWDITDSHKAKMDLENSEAKYRFLFEKSSVFSLVISKELLIKDINNASIENLGYSKEELVGKNVMDFIVPEDCKKSRDALIKVFVGEESPSLEVNIYAKDKSIHTILFSQGQQFVFSDSGEPFGALFTGVDITDRKKAERQQLFVTTGLRAVLEAADKLIACPDIDSVFKQAIEFARERFGLERCAIFVEEDGLVRGIYGTDRFGRTTDERSLRFEKNEIWKRRLKMLDTRDPNWAVVREPQLEWDGKSSVQIGEGWIVVTPIQSAHRPIGVFVNDSAISNAVLDPVKQDTLAVFCSLIGSIIERKRAEQKLEVVNKRLLQTSRRFKQMAIRDSHTGLFNHRYLIEIIDSEFNRAKRYGFSLSYIMLDLDYFKSVNDVYGHQFGDLILKQFARHLKKTVRQYDILVRFGGEEFVIISPGIDRETAIVLSQRILNSVYLKSFGNQEHSVKLKLSIAISSFPEDNVTSGMDLVNIADKILNKAKEDGGDRVYCIENIKTNKCEVAQTVNGHNSVQSLQEKLEKLTKRANQSLIESIFAFAKTIKLKDNYTGEHVENTVYFASEIAKKLNLPENKIEQVRQAAQLHDLGKIGISDKILLKKSKLSKPEFEEIKKHPMIAADILRPIHFLQDIIPSILYHHERWDGKGYPFGLKDEEIPIGARIVAISDVYQALISDRPYRPAFNKSQAMRMIKAGSGTQFDPKIVEAFLSLI